MLLALRAALISLILATSFALAAGPQYKVIHTFQGSPDGADPYAGLVMDASGNLYGTTEDGGMGGTVFQLVRGTGGSWTENILFDFSNQQVDGHTPIGNVMYRNGNVYGTSQPGGANNGIVFELTPTQTGFWNFNVLYSMTGPLEGFQPWSGVIFDSAGNLYGTTVGGGSYSGSAGVVYQLVRGQNGWMENILHAFTGLRDGYAPTNDLVMGKDGSLYGTTMWGGEHCPPYGCGVVFKLSQSNGAWTFQDIYTFKGGTDGIAPFGALVFDKAGNLYGTTSVGGIGICTISSTPGCGTVFKLTPRPVGEWQKTILYSPDGSSGGGLFGGVVFDAAGNLYGTSTFYGKFGQGDICAAGCGSVFKLTPSNGTWTATTLYEFGGDPDGGEPFDRLLVDKAGHLYGTAYYFGSSTGSCAILGCGVVFEIAP